MRLDKMKLLKSAVIGLAVLAASASTAFARDYYSVGVNVGNYSYGAPLGYSFGYSNYPPVYQPRVVYYEPVRYYQPVIVRSVGYGYHDHGYYHGYRGHHGDYGYRGHNDREFRGHDFNGHGFGEGRHDKHR